MDDGDELASRFEEHRGRLRVVAYRLLGSQSDAEDALQEAWLRLDRSDAAAIENLGGWLTTVVARICLNVLRARRARPEDPLELRLPDLVVGPADADERGHPEPEALLADGVGVALLVVLDALSPAERLAFVLHDVFAMPFEEVAAVIDRSPEATRQLASRARRRVREGAPTPDGGASAQREVVDAFFEAARSGEFARLVAVLHADAVLSVDAGGPGSVTVAGAERIAARALMFADPTRTLTPVTVNGVAGVVVRAEGVPAAVMAFTVVDGRVARIDVLADGDRLARMDLDPSVP